MISCNTVETGPRGNGTLDFRMSAWNAYHSENKSDVPKISSHGGIRNTVRTLDIVDIRGFKSEIAVSTVDISEGVSPRDVEWITIYESDQVLLHTEREAIIDIPAGK